METILRRFAFVVVLGCAVLLAACGGGGGGTAGGGGGGAATDGAVAIEIASDGELLAFDQTTLTVPAGQQVTLTFENTSVAQQHNWVLIEGDENVAREIATDGIIAGLEAEYLPVGQENVIAHTGVLEAGETRSITFTAPGPGTYLYICTVPGHYPLMQGTMTVN